MLIDEFYAVVPIARTEESSPACGLRGECRPETVLALGIDQNEKRKAFVVEWVWLRVVHTFTPSRLQLLI